MTTGSFGLLDNFRSRELCWAHCGFYRFYRLPVLSPRGASAFNALLIVQLKFAVGKGNVAEETFEKSMQCSLINVSFEALHNFTCKVSAL